MKRIFLGFCTCLICLLLIYLPSYSEETECYNQFNKDLSYALARYFSRDEIGLRHLQPWGWVPEALYDGEDVDCITWAKKAGGNTDEIIAKANKCNQIKRMSITVLNQLDCYCDFADTPCQNFQNAGMSKCTEWVKHQLLKIQSGKVSYCKTALLRRFFREAEFAGYDNPIAGLQALILYPKKKCSTIRNLSSSDTRFFIWCLKKLHDEHYLLSGIVSEYLKNKKWHPIYRINDGVAVFQQALNRNGFMVSVDGIWGEEAIHAMQSYQQAAGIKKSHFPDHKTLRALNVDENEFYRKTVNKDILGLLEKFEDSSSQHNEANSGDTTLAAD